MQKAMNQVWKLIRGRFGGFYAILIFYAWKAWNSTMILRRILVESAWNIKPFTSTCYERAHRVESLTNATLLALSHTLPAPRVWCLFLSPSFFKVHQYLHREPRVIDSRGVTQRKPGTHTSSLGVSWYWWGHTCHHCSRAKSPSCTDARGIDP